MASIEEKVNCVLWLAELKSVTAVLGRFRSHYNKEPPHRNSISRWMKKFQETGSVNDRPRFGRVSIEALPRNLVPEEFIKQGSLFKNETIKQDGNDEGESDDCISDKGNSMSPAGLMSPSLQHGSHDCEDCQLLSEGKCPKHEHQVYVDNDERHPVGVHVADVKQELVSDTEIAEKLDASDAHDDDDSDTIEKTNDSNQSDRSSSETNVKSEPDLTDNNSELKYQIKTEVEETDCVKSNPACDLCAPEFTYCSHLNIKKKRLRSEEKRFICNVCGMGFAERGNLRRHKRIHTGDKPYKCDVCGIAFAQSGHLKSHRRTHTQEKPFNCEVCNLAFAEPGHLKRHVRRHTGERPYKCDVCTASFTVKVSLRTHMRTHTGEKPYKCQVCGVGFSQSGGLKSHSRTHTLEKPYRCDVCGVGFAESGVLITHKRTHTGEKPFKCDICGVGFAQRGHLKGHIRTHFGLKSKTTVRKRPPKVLKPEANEQVTRDIEQS